MVGVASARPGARLDYAAPPGSTCLDTTPPSRLQLPPGPWQTLIDGLCGRFPRIDRATWLDRFARGRVQDRDGVALAPDTPYRCGEDIRYFREVPDETVIEARHVVLHADADLVVVDKPHFLPVVPAGRFVRETLLRRLIDELGNPALVPLHRLDRLTAGLVLFSANPATRDAYQALFRERRIGKQYEAWAAPLPAREFPLVHRSRLETGDPFFMMRDVAGEPNSETVVDVLERLSNVWRYRLRPLTGRKHQLRVHMAALGAPIAGDPLYPSVVPEDGSEGSMPLALLACGLQFDDPLDGRRREFRTSLSLRRPEG